MRIVNIPEQGKQMLIIRQRIGLDLTGAGGIFRV